MRIFLTAAAMLLVTTGAPASAQAPVVDLNSQASNQVKTTTVTPEPAEALGTVEMRLATLERKDMSRIEAQQRMQGQLDVLQNEVDQIRGSIELHNHQLEKILQRQRELYLELDNRFSALQQQTDTVQSNLGNAAGTAATPVLSASPAPSAGSATSGLSEEQAYQAAVNLILKERDYDKAIPAFETFLASYPSSSFTDNAHYWLGQLLFNKQDWAGARTQFQQVVNNFTNSTKRADSLYKLGMLEKSQGNKPQAKTYFEQVVAEYSQTTSARLATQQLSSL